MIVYNQELSEDDCDFKVTKKTENFLVSFFGFYNHYIYEDFNNFLKELNVKEVIENYPKTENDFKINGNNALEVYNVCDRRTFDVAIVLPTLFESEKDAIEWFNQKVKESDYIKKSEIDVVAVLDADGLMLFLDKKREYIKKEKEIKNVFEKGMSDLKKSMLNDYPDKDSKYIIENLFR